MATEEDNFDIDIYGDGGEDYDNGQGQNTDQQDLGQEMTGQSEFDPTVHESGSLENQGPHSTDGANDGAQSSIDLHQLNVTAFEANQSQQMSSLKRKEGADERQLDPGATAALFVSDLHWWITDDEIRGWANQCSCEDELREITFHEHKVNGKSKGQAYVSFESPQAATAVKHKIDSFVEAQVYKQKFTVSFANPSTNPFKTLPKDGNARNNNSNNVQGSRSSSGGFHAGGTGTQSQGGYNSGGYRGRGGYNNRGGFNRGGYSQPIPGSYQGGGAGGFQAPAMGGMQPYNNFGNRGGMMGGGMRGGNMNMRGGGRGAMNHGNMMGNYMGGMNMGGMPNMGMGMPQMNGGMGMQGFQAPGFFQQGAVDSSWNPHGAKRTRQE